MSRAWAGLSLLLVPLLGPTPTPSPSAVLYSPPRSPVSDRVLDVTDRTVQSGIRETQGKDTELALDTDVLFAFGSATLTAVGRTTLTEAVKQLKAKARGSVAVNGYTDAIGSTSANLDLSRRRATAVLQALTPMLSGTGLRLSAHGYGEADPVASNTLPNGKDNPEGRTLNRRVSLVYQS